MQDEVKIEIGKEKEQQFGKAPLDQFGKILMWMNEWMNE